MSRRTARALSLAGQVLRKRPNCAAFDGVSPAGPVSDVPVSLRPLSIRLTSTARDGSVVKPTMRTREVSSCGTPTNGWPTVPIKASSMNTYTGSAPGEV